MNNVMIIYFKDSFKDGIVDCLFNFGFDDFYYFDCKKYSSKSLFSTKEKVTGRVDYGKFEVMLGDESDGEKIANKLYNMFGDKDLKIYFTRF